MGTPEPRKYRLNRDDLAGRRGIDLLATADVDADMRYPVIGIGVGAREKHQVAWLELFARYVRRRVVLLLRCPRQVDAELSKYELDQAGAIQANSRIGAAEDIRNAQV